MNEKNFIKTSDEETAEKLKNEGFTLLSKDGGVFCFLNDGKMNFADGDNNKMIYSNILNV